MYKYLRITLKNFHIIYGSYKNYSPPYATIPTSSVCYVLPKEIIKSQRVEKVEKHSYTLKNLLSK